ncbi:MAG: prolyl oligopeptidase family serine peptidase [Armatimonadota bacterium]
MRRLYCLCLLATVCSTIVWAGSDIDTLQSQVDDLAERHSDDVSDTWRTNYPYARLQIRKALTARSSDGGSWTDSRIQPFLDRAQQAIEHIHSDRPRKAVPGTLTELAYITCNDNTAQPYHLYLPPDYTPDTPTPLIVFLHGWVPTTSILDPWLLPQDVLDIAGRHGCMLLIPYGRRNTDFQGVGEMDVLRTMEEVQSLYPVDGDRIYLNGVSMGGMGAWTIALRHPGLFTAVTPVAGQTEMYRWWGWDKSKMAPFKRWLVEWDNPYHLAPAMRNQRFFVQHGENDSLIPAEQSRLMVQKARELDGASVEYDEYADTGHYIYFDTEPFKRAFAWQVQFAGRPTRREVSHKTYSLEYNRAFWATIEQFKRWGDPAQFTCRLTPDPDESSGPQIELDCSNVARLSIDLQAAPLKPRDSYLVRTPEGERNIQPDGDRLVISLEEAPSRAESFPPSKRRGLCGPCEEVFDDSFLVVQGTGGDNEDDRVLARKVRRFSREWDAFADGFPRVKLDRQVTGEDIAQSNLVLFGRPQTNLLLARIYFRLPVRIGDHRYQVGEREYAGDDLGLVMCYPNPLNPDRYVLIFSGEFWGEKLDVNHKFDMLPDFIIFTTKRLSPEGRTNEHLCAGFFDIHWKLSEDTTWSHK